MVIYTYNIIYGFPAKNSKPPRGGYTPTTQNQHITPNTPRARPPHTPTPSNPSYHVKNCMVNLFAKHVRGPVVTWAGLGEQENETDTGVGEPIGFLLVLLLDCRACLSAVSSVPSQKLMTLVDWCKGNLEKNWDVSLKTFWDFNLLLVTWETWYYE